MSAQDPGVSWDDLGRAAARREDAAAAAGALRRELLLLSLDGAPYALPVERVREIVRLRPITPMPRVPEAIRGVISLRGEIVQVIDLRRRLGLARDDGDAAERARRARIVVLHGEGGHLTGLLVDRVTEVLRVPEEALRPARGDSDTVESLCPRGDEFVSLFDVDRVLAVGEGA